MKTIPKSKVKLGIVSYRKKIALVRDVSPINFRLALQQNNSNVFR